MFKNNHQNLYNSHLSFSFMPSQDTTQLKEKILQTLKRRGPSLPVHIANETGLSILFASAFLSELISDRKIKISNLRVGSSPIYFIPGQEHRLEKYSHHLKSREKDAYLLLKEKKFLEDSSQDPAIRVALRQIKDFAIGFQKDNKIFWRYFKVPETDFQEEKISEKPITQTEITENKNELILPKKVEDKKEDLGIFDKEESEKPETKKEKKKTSPSQKKNEKFFDVVKKYLLENSIEITGIEGFSKNDLILKIKENNHEKILLCLNRKTIKEGDLTKANKKAQEENLEYSILALGEPTKKMSTLIETIKNLSEIKKL